MDFVYDADGRYILNGTAHDTLSSFLTASGGTFARSSIGTYYDSTGTLQIAASGSPRFDYDPSNANAPRGLLIEESRTNQLKNSQFTGAAIGVSPSNVIVSPGGSGITASITAVGTTNGENYMEVMFSGTSTAGGTIYPNVFFTPAAADLVPAAQGQAWTGRIHIISDTGTSPNNLQVQLAELTSGNVYLDASNVNTTGGAYLTVTRTLTNASTAYIRFIILTSLAPGQSINRTIRFSVPQLERGAFATSYIPTTGSTVTRSADSLTLPPSTWFNGTTGTWYASFDGGRESNQGYYGRVVSPDSSYTALSTDGGNTLTVGTWTGGTASRITTTTDFYTTAGKAALGYDQTTLTRSISARGLTPVTTSYTGTYNATSGTIGIGRNAASTTNMLNGHIQSLKFYPLRADDTQLQLLTQ